MARHLRVEFSGAIYHVTCRMIDDRRLDQSRLFYRVRAGIWGNEREAQTEDEAVSGIYGMGIGPRG